jgi:cytochrome c
MFNGMDRDMFNTMTLVKVVGGIGAPLLLFLFGNWAATALFATGGGHGEEYTQGYTVEVEGAAAPAEEEAASDEPTFEDLLAAADVAKGEKTFGKCKACHKLEEGVNATGPSLFGVVGRDVGKAEGFGYSGGMAELGGQWTPERMSEFLTKPKDYVPGTKMSFSGLKKATDRANLIAYLATIGG